MKSNKRVFNTKRKRRKPGLKSRGPVSPKSARGAGRTSDTKLSTATGTPAIDRELAEALSCDALVSNIEVVYFKKQRKRSTPNGKAGSWYNGQVVKGDKCGALAIMTKYVEGKRVHRCAKHIGS